jgi:NADH-quinone oxidoreductase subunit L
VFFAAAAGGAAITAFYMFRMWYLTFAGKPRNQERYDHAHESPVTMYAPLIILSVFAVTVAWGGREGSMRWVELLTGTGIAGAISAWLLLRHRSVSESEGDHHHDAAGDHHHANPEWWIWTPAILTGVVLLLGLLWQIPALHSVSLAGLLEQSRPVPLADVHGQWTSLIWPDEHFAHKLENHAKIVIPVTLLATATALAGIGLATVMYCLGWLNPQDVRRSFQSIHTFLLNKWWFDELYQLIWVRPSLWIGRLIARFDKSFIDWMVDGSARVARSFSQFWNYWADQFAVDGLVNLIARWTHTIGLALRGVQTGRLRQYVMFIVLGTTVVFILVSFWKSAFAG